MVLPLWKAEGSALILNVFRTKSNVMDRVFQRDGLGSVQPPHAARPGGQVTAGRGGGSGCWVHRGGSAGEAGGPAPLGPSHLVCLALG